MAGTAGPTTFETTFTCGENTFPIITVQGEIDPNETKEEAWARHIQAIRDAEDECDS